MRSAFYDFDGTIVDSETVRFQKWAAQIGPNGGAVTRARWDNIVDSAVKRGVSTTHALHEQLLPHATRNDVANLESEVLNSVISHPPFGYIHRWLASAKSAGCQQVIVTNNGERHVKEYLRRHELADLVCAVVGRETVGTRFKPDPYGYQMARSWFAGEPSFAIEDRISGVHAARSAGLRTLRINERGSTPMPGVFTMTRTEAESFGWSEVTELLGTIKPWGRQTE